MVLRCLGARENVYSPPVPPERRMVREKQTKREGDYGKGIERPVRLLLKSFRYVLGQFRELPSPDQCLKEQGIYMRIAFFVSWLREQSRVYMRDIRSARFPS